MTDELLVGQISHPGEIRKYILGGNATFTLDGGDLFGRFTYKVKSTTADRAMNWSTGNQDKSAYFVSVLSGPSNESDFQYMGMLKKDPIGGEYKFASTLKSRVKDGAESFEMFKHYWLMLEEACKPPSWIDFWHEGVCCICGRKLTVPESVAAGIGPECASKGGM